MSETEIKEVYISDDGANRGEVVDINTLAVRHTTIGKSPEEVFQTAFRDNNGGVRIGKKYTALKLGDTSKDGYEYILGYNTTTGKLRHKTLASTSLDFYGIHSNGVSNTSYYIIKNDTYGKFTTDNVQITGFVREHFKRKIIYLGTELDIGLIGDDSDKFNPEWWKTEVEDDQPFTNTPLIPANTLAENHMLQEAKGFRINVYDTDPAMKYEGAYTWTGHIAPTVEDIVTVDYMPVDKNIIFDMPEQELEIKMDGSGNGVITITAGTTNITITKDGNIQINSAGALDINVTDDTTIDANSVLMQGGANEVIAENDGITLSGLNISGATGAITITGLIIAGNMGAPVPVSAITFTHASFSDSAGSLTGTITGGDASVKVD